MLVNVEPTYMKRVVDFQPVSVTWCGFKISDCDWDASSISPNDWLVQTQLGSRTVRGSQTFISTDGFSLL